MEEGKLVSEVDNDTNQVSQFVESYETFNRILNSLQRKYIELKDEFSNQNSQLAEANRRLVELSRENLAANDFLNGILKALSVGVVAVDQNGRITHFNPAASAILGIPPQDSVGKQYREVVPAGKPASANALRAAECGKAVESVERKIDLDDGARLQLSVSTAILRDDRGRANGAVEVFQDLTKLKRMEEEIARLNTLAALGEMAATIAHEVRNPLAGIAGFASLLEQDVAKDDPKRKLIRKIQRGVAGLNDTITALMNYSRLEKLNRTTINYPDFLTKAIRRFESENRELCGKARISLVEAGPPSSRPLEMSIDALLFQQVFNNLFTNAIEVAHDNCEISIRYRRLPRQTAVARYSSRMLLDTRETVVETVISDNGPGIPMDSLDHIFAPFFTTKQGGHGLGLALAWKIVKAHGGEIFAQSSSRQGTSFYILLPVPIGSENME